VLRSVQRFRTISNQPFLNRGTVRRGGLAFLEFAAFEREKMLLHIFRAESGAMSRAPRNKAYRAQEPRRRKTGRGFKWQGPREFMRRGGEPFEPQTVLLRLEASAGGELTWR
jgi:hypothetical protein